MLSKAKLRKATYQSKEVPPSPPRKPQATQSKAKQRKAKLSKAKLSKTKQSSAKLSQE